LLLAELELVGQRARLADVRELPLARGGQGGSGMDVGPATV